MRSSIKRATLALGLGGLLVLPQSQSGHAAAKVHATDVTLNVWYHAYGEAGTHQAVENYASQYEQSHPASISTSPGWWAKARIRSSSIRPC